MSALWLMSTAGTAHAAAKDVQLVQGHGTAACARRVHFNLASDGEEPKCAECVVVVRIECGTYAGYQRHRRKKTPPCEACRRANNLYQKHRRVVAGRDRDHKSEGARHRARMRPMREFPDRFAELLAEELAT